MIFVAVVLALAGGVFYAASDRASGAWATPLCYYGDVLCQHPTWLLIAAILALIWGLLLRVDAL